MWNVDSSDEYDAWFLTLDEESKEAVLQRVLLLRQTGRIFLVHMQMYFMVLKK